MRPGVRALLLVSDTYSPMAAPHGLPALHWPRLAAAMLEKEEGDGGHMHAVAAIEDRLRQGGWDPQWRFGMYSQAHYHSTTHELLTVVQAGATIQLGGTDSRAKPPPAPAPQGGDKEAPTSKTVELQAGDVLLLPAGYTHRAVHSRSGFTMIGSYPAQAEEWDMRFPNVMGCPHDVEKIRSVVQGGPRKGLFAAQSPDTIFERKDSSAESGLATNWGIEG